MNFRDKGEKIAARHLQKSGYKILDHNFHGRDFEIDLIARKKNLLIFVEVKRRTSSIFMQPVESINLKKRRDIIRGAKYYLLSNDLYDKVDVRFDVITIKDDNGNLEHYEDAFRI